MKKELKINIQQAEKLSDLQKENIQKLKSQLLSINNKLEFVQQELENYQNLISEINSYDPDFTDVFSFIKNINQLLLLNRETFNRASNLNDSSVRDITYKYF